MIVGTGPWIHRVLEAFGSHVSPQPTTSPLNKACLPNLAADKPTRLLQVDGVLGSGFLVAGIIGLVPGEQHQPQGQQHPGSPAEEL